MSYVDPSKSSSTSPPQVPFHLHAFLAKVREMGRQVEKLGLTSYKVQCPGPLHKQGDRNPSLSVGLGDNGDIILNCFAGCTKDTSGKSDPKPVLDAMGLPPSLLFREQTPKPLIGSAPKPPEKPTLPPPPNEPGMGRIFTPVEEYPYTDEQGVVLSKAIRLVDQFGVKSFTQVRPSGEPGIKGIRRVLYRLHTWHGKKKTLAFAEGEKDVHTLQALGFPATTNMGGSGSWRPDYIEQMKTGGVERLLVFGDNDDSGKKHAERVASEAYAAGINVKVVPLDGLPPKGDITDWVAIPGNTKEKLTEIVKGTKPWAPAEVVIVNPDDDERHMIETEPFPEQARVGMAHEFAMLFAGRSDAPYEFLYMSFLTALAAACSPYVTVGAGFTAQRVGLYTVLVGASFSGRKTSSRNWVLEFFEGLDVPWIYVPEAIPGSDVGLIKLAKKAAGRPMLMNPDEFSELTSKASIKGSTYTELLNKLFDSPRIGGISKTFDVEARVEFSLLSATTDALWTESFTSNTMQVGFLNRLFRVPAYRTRSIQTVQAPDAEGIKVLRGLVIRALRRVASSPVRMEMSPEAEQVYLAWGTRCKEAKMINCPDYARLETYAQRMAAVLTVAAWGKLEPDVQVDPVVDPLSMSIACALADWQYRARLWSRPVNADNPYAIREAQLRAYLARVLREPALIEGGPPRVAQGRRIRKRDVQQHFGHWGAKAFNWAVEAMENGQEIEVVGVQPDEVYLQISNKGLFNALR